MSGRAATGQASFSSPHFGVLYADVDRGVTGHNYVTALKYMSATDSSLILDGYLVNARERSSRKEKPKTAVGQSTLTRVAKPVPGLVTGKLRFISGAHSKAATLPP